MPSFLVTFKPATENPERGWPLEKLRQLVQQHHEHGPATGEWRFRNRKAVPNDRVFLVRQGKDGAAIIGYGRVIGAPSKHVDTGRAPVEFEELVDPVTHVLARSEELETIAGGERFWKSRSSGVLETPGKRAVSQRCPAQRRG